MTSWEQKTTVRYLQATHVEALKQCRQQQRQAQADWDEKNNKRELKINEFGGICMACINGNWEECKVISRGREMTVVRVARLIDGQPGWRDCGCINDCVTELAPSLIGRKSVFWKRGVEELRIIEIVQRRIDSIGDETYKFDIRSLIRLLSWIQDEISCFVPLCETKKVEIIVGMWERALQKRAEIEEEEEKARDVNCEDVMNIWQMKAKTRVDISSAERKFSESAEIRKQIEEVKSRHYMRENAKNVNSSVVGTVSRGL